MASAVESVPRPRKSWRGTPSLSPSLSLSPFAFGALAFPFPFPFPFLGRSPPAAKETSQQPAREPGAPAGLGLELDGVRRAGLVALVATRAPIEIEARLQEDTAWDHGHGLHLAGPRAGAARGAAGPLEDRPRGSRRFGERHQPSPICAIAPSSTSGTLATLGSFTLVPPIAARNSSFGPSIIAPWAAPR